MIILMRKTISSHRQRFFRVVPFIELLVVVLGFLTFVYGSLNPKATSIWSTVALHIAQPDSILHGVACSSSKSCWAVGSTASNPLILHWNGTSWKTYTFGVLEGSGNSSLAAVSCGSISNCFAVGTFIPKNAQTGGVSGGFGIPIVLQYNGREWSVIPTPNFLGNAVDLTHVSCVSTTTCYIGGTGTTGDRTVGSVAYIEKDTGFGWNIIATSAQTASSHNVSGGFDLSAEACVSTTCMISEKADSENESFFSVDNGSSWHADTLPAPIIDLEGLECSNATDCTGIGASQSGLVVAHWNGSSWSTQSLPDPSNNRVSKHNNRSPGYISPNWPSEPSKLSSIACTSSSVCIAVGDCYSLSGMEPLIETNEDGNWTVKVPRRTKLGDACSKIPFSLGGPSLPEKTKAKASSLNSVACSSKSECWAVGSETVQSGVNQRTAPFVEMGSIVVNKRGIPLQIAGIVIGSIGVLLLILTPVLVRKRWATR